MSAWGPKLEEMAEDLLATAAIGYWANAEWVGSALLVTEIEGDAEALITPASLLDWLNGREPLALIRALGDPYQRGAVAGLMAHDHEGVDYDAETGDVVLQAMVLGRIVYG